MIFIFVFLLCSSFSAYANHYLTPTTPLAQAFPNLVHTLPYISLGDFPTPVHRIEKLGNQLKLPNLYIKRDDLSGELCDEGFRLFGGNKVRKLEFILADALNSGAKTVLTYGAAGSNHATATATYTARCNLDCILMLKPQSPAPGVQRNLCLMGMSGAQIYYTSAEDRPSAALRAMELEKKEVGQFPYEIPTGGSCPLGAIGFVNAIFELKQQIECGELPEPDVIYVTASSCGTIAGLLVGIHAADLDTKIVGVAIEPEECSGALHAKIMELAHHTNQLMHQYDSEFPLFENLHDRFRLIHDVCGQDYGLPTDLSETALATMLATEQIALDGTYTAKTMSALMRDAQEKLIPSDAVILFWDSYCGDVIGSLYAEYDYHRLPESLWTYFENIKNERKQ